MENHDGSVIEWRENATKKMPKQKPGRSKQTYGTPWSFIDATKALLGIPQTDFDIDLAALPKNKKCHRFIAPQSLQGAHEGLVSWNALAQPTWRFGMGWNWLNPPFEKLGPWVDKAWTEWHTNYAQTAMLVPAAVGSNWWRDYVHSKAKVLLLNGRLTFEGETLPYIKDCALLLYGRAPGYWVWTWKHGTGGLK